MKNKPLEAHESHALIAKEACYHTKKACLRYPMCLIIFDWQPESERILTLASNRDEFYQRPSLAAQFWDDHPGIYGGRDLKMGGTWLAVSAGARLAAVTNFRIPEQDDFDLSRGEIPFQFLSSDISSPDFAEQLEKKHADYPGFNALLFDGTDIVYSCNRTDSRYQVLEPGHYGLSNHSLNTPWPKVEQAKKSLLLTQSSVSKTNETLLEALKDRHAPPDHLLPDTGFGMEFERMLSPIFIESPHYGTRASSVVIIEKSGAIHFTERRYDANGCIDTNSKTLNDEGSNTVLG